MNYRHWNGRLMRRTKWIAVNKEGNEQTSFKGLVDMDRNKRLQDVIFTFKNANSARQELKATHQTSVSQFGIVLLPRLGLACFEWNALNLLLLLLFSGHFAADGKGQGPIRKRTGRGLSGNRFVLANFSPNFWD